MLIRDRLEIIGQVEAFGFSSATPGHPFQGLTKCGNLPLGIGKIWVPPTFFVVETFYVIWCWCAM